MKPKSAIAILKAAFPQKDLEQATIQLYEQRMRDIGPLLLEATVNRLVDRARFFPTIAEIRETAAGIAGILPMSPEEALAIIREADQAEDVYTRDGEYRYTERHWRWPADLTPVATELVWEALAKVGNPADRDGKPVFGWELDFKKVYGRVADGRRHLALANLSQAALPAPPKALPLPQIEGEVDEELDEAGLERAREMIRRLSDSLG